MAAIQISTGKWVKENPHGRTFFRIAEDGLHVQSITDNGNTVIGHDEMLISFDQLEDVANKQGSLI